MNCPTIPSATFAGPVADGFVGALNETYVGDPSNAVGVSQFWTGVQILAANAGAASVDGATDATRATLLTNSNAVAGGIAPLSSTPAGFAEPAGYQPAVTDYPMYAEASTTAGLIASDPALFPAAYYCPVGQGADFIAKYRDLSPENPAATNVGEYSSIRSSRRTSSDVPRLNRISVRGQLSSLCPIFAHVTDWVDVFAQL